MKSIPNLLTLFRIVLVPISWVLLLIDPFDWRTWVLGVPVPFWGVLLVILAGASDILDGILARKYRAQSNFGKLMDPIADKAFITSCWIFLTMMGRLHPVGVALAVTRDILINGLRNHAAAEGIVIGASQEAKLKTILQYVSLGMLIHAEWMLIFPWIDMLTLGQWLFWAALVLSYFSFLQYWRRFYGKGSQVSGRTSARHRK
jgi:CDP-diacylglycerol--glycerol-3-phosphate 3-phosphatidyltransferase